MFNHVFTTRKWHFYAKFSGLSVPRNSLVNNLVLPDPTVEVALID